ncbi:MAG: 4Fe-4S dicluster domain-containing protein, partial [Candidatus Nanopelagicales bacterium]|nr:4Fe-4S dicluster domain-containing protein [Candidatus Nanopelagicales bacterium]
MARPETDLQGEVVALCGGLGLDLLLQGIARQGYRLVGPTVRNGAIGVDVIDGAQDLPQGWTDQQAPGSYRILRRDDQAYFGFSSPPGGWKRYLFPAHSVLWRSTTHGDGIEIKPASDDPGPTAFIGIRSCDLAAIEIQDRIFLSRGNPDPIYEARRENLLLIGVDCREPGPLCFCESMDCGPRADGADLRITELGPDDPATHRFVVRAQTPLGSDVLAGSGIEKIDQSARPVDMDDLAADRFPSPADDCVPGRVVNTDRLAELLVAEAESPVWDDIAERCLACGNCTMVCPTCFCSDVDDLPVIPPGGQERIRQWASCFELDHSYIHGGSIRQSIKSRYRQWLTHKFSSWWDQFGSSGCVGCGRCIASCPVGIDVTESLAAIRDG